MHVEIAWEVIDPAAWIHRIRQDEDGAIALFLGVVRNNADGKTVTRIEYSAYAEMALKVMREISEDLKKKFGIEDAALVHRVGDLRVGETSLLVALAAPHRVKVFEALPYVVDRIKQDLPVWKKEFFTDGHRWVGMPAPDETSGDSKKS